MLCKTGNAQSRTTFFHHSAISWVFQLSCCLRSLLSLFSNATMPKGEIMWNVGKMWKGESMYFNQRWGIHSTSSQIKVSTNYYCHDLNFAFYFVSRGVAVFVSLSVSYQQTSSRSFALTKGYCSTCYSDNFDHYSLFDFTESVSQSGSLSGAEVVLG